MEQRGLVKALIPAASWALENFCVQVSLYFFNEPHNLKLLSAMWREIEGEERERERERWREEREAGGEMSEL